MYREIAFPSNSGKKKTESKQKYKRRVKME
jgi:hypothetical protein